MASPLLEHSNNRKGAHDWKNQVEERAADECSVSTVKVSNMLTMAHLKERESRFANWARALQPEEKYDIIVAVDLVRAFLKYAQGNFTRNEAEKACSLLNLSPDLTAEGFRYADFFRNHPDSWSRIFASVTAPAATQENDDRQRTKSNWEIRKTGDEENFASIADHKQFESETDDGKPAKIGITEIGKQVGKSSDTVISFASSLSDLQTSPRRSMATAETRENDNSTATSFAAATRGNDSGNSVSGNAADHNGVDAQVPRAPKEAYDSIVQRDSCSLATADNAPQASSMTATLGDTPTSSPQRTLSGSRPSTNRAPAANGNPASLLILESTSEGHSADSPPPNMEQARSSEIAAIGPRSIPSSAYSSCCTIS